MNAHIGPKIRLYVSIAMFLGSALVFGLGALSPKAGGALAFAKLFGDNEPALKLVDISNDKNITIKKRDNIYYTNQTSLKIKIEGGKAKKIKYFLDDIYKDTILNSDGYFIFTININANAPTVFKASELDPDNAILNENSISTTIKNVNKALKPESISPTTIEGKSASPRSFVLSFPTEAILDESTLSRARLADDKGDLESADLKPVANTSTATIDLKDPNRGGTFTLKIDKGIKDLYGNELDGGYVNNPTLKITRASIGPVAEKPVFEKIVIGETKKNIEPSKTKSIKTNIIGDYTFTLADFKTTQAPNKVQLFVDTSGQAKMVEIDDKKAKDSFVYKMANNGKYTFSAVTIRDGTNSEEKSDPSDAITFEVNKRVISPESIEPSILEGPVQRSQAILVKYPKEMDLSSSKTENNLFKLSPKEGQNLTDISAKFVERIAPNIFRVLFDDPVPGAYVLKIGAKTSSAQISDDYGNTNDTEFSLPFSRSSNTESTVSDINDPRGLRGETGKNVSFQEFDVVPENQRQKPGFNPEDKVETRVVRLYYTRDAHRVARILNRTAQSYNRLGLDTQRSGADRARREADTLTDDRRRLDRLAIQAAGETRAIEAQIAKVNAEYQNAQANTAGRLAQLQSIQGNYNRKLDDLNNDLIEWKGKQGPIEQQVQIDEQAKAKRQTDKTNWDKQWQMDKDAELAKTEDPTQKSLIAIKYDKIKASHDQAFEQTEFIQGQPAQTRKDQLSVLKNRIASIQSEKEAISQNAPSSAAAGSNSELDALKKSLEDSQRRKIEELNQLTAKLENLRNIENQAREASLAAEAKESRAREDQFRREVASAMEDPDTYAPGQPGSQDSFERVSISVIGEGLIQLRGPMKGINNIRRAIHHIDAPLGQVRLGIHTVQINGERGERMEKVATRIQTYLDQSRFLTSQSAQMLRKAVAKVASERAYSAPNQNLPPNADPTGQLSRDYRYLVAFFGADFLRELQVMDSEFLRTGNKLLSLHSMDSTSLASTLFLISLAKNEVRREILEEFDRLLQTELPNAEYAYITPMAATCDKQLGHKGAYQLFAAHARFQSLRGFLNGESVDTDGLNPTQREFLRLAQILKGQVITETEIKQRVMERSLIEQRIAESKDLANGEDSPAKKERDAREAFEKATIALEIGKNEALSVAKLIEDQINSYENKIEDSTFDEITNDQEDEKSNEQKIENNDISKESKVITELQKLESIGIQVQSIKNLKIKEINSRKNYGIIKGEYNKAAKIYAEEEEKLNKNSQKKGPAVEAAEKEGTLGAREQLAKEQLINDNKNTRINAKIFQGYLESDKKRFFFIYSK